MKKQTLSFLPPSAQKMIKKHFQALIVGSIFLTLLVGTFVAVELSQKEQEIRQQASTPSGTVEVIGATNPSPGIAGQPVEIIFRANTHGVNVSGFQFVGTLTGPSGMFTSPPTVQAVSSSGLVVLGTPAITDNGNGSYNFAFGFIHPSITPIYNSDTFQDVGKLIVTPQQAGDMSLSFDEVNTKSETVVDTVISDVLKTMQPMTFTVIEEGGQATNTPFPTATMCAQPTQPLCQDGESVVCNDTAPGSAVCQLCTCVGGVDPTPTNTPEVTVTEEPAPTATPIVQVNPTATPDDSGTGGTTIRYCGESCSAHADCAVNLMCYGGVCRLANNPTDAYCNSPADQGISRVCNEYCADSRECDDNLTCYYNRCRNPRNVTDSYCSAPVAAYSSPRPTSAARVVTATPVVPTSTPQPQGGDDTPFGSNQVVPTKVLPTNTPWPTYAPIATATPAADDEFTIAERIQGFIKGLLIIALAISAIFLLLWLLPLFFKKRRHDDDDDLPPTTPGTGIGTSTYSDELHKKTSGDNP